MFIDDTFWLLMSVLTSGVASIADGIEQSFASYDIDDSHITHSLDKTLSRKSEDYVQNKAKMENKLEELEAELASRYNMAHAWGIDSVEVFNEAKARAFSERTPESEWELGQMSKLYSLRRQCVASRRDRIVSNW
ncbi:hypothetical protein ARMGADRAFT_1168098 [Armillaria gallica]|uniref:Uncharacterized protein n=1 Tax=Armillaria gallica TaxID=47427 RepID=A0A2H3DH39_ARMGA|nr:hypothetical protein ARMGADRAFT_1168098 [Armillaria gallica]